MGDVSYINGVRFLRLGFVAFFSVWVGARASGLRGAVASSSLESEAHSGPSSAASFFSMSLALASIFLDVGMVIVGALRRRLDCLLALRLRLQPAAAKRWCACSLVCAAEMHARGCSCLHSENACQAVCTLCLHPHFTRGVCIDDFASV